MLQDYVSFCQYIGKMTFYTLLISGVTDLQFIRAEQEVTLQSGTTLVGEVRLKEQQVVISINDAEIELPLAQVKSITPTGTKTRAGKEAQGLLLSALETRILKNKEISSKLMAHAYKLKPNDPHVVFWYAHSLTTSGGGKAADFVYRKHEQAIAVAYPIWADKLRAMIEQRVAIEKYPRRLVKRLDELANQQAPTSRNREDRILKHLVFRLHDQKGAPINQSAFRVQCDGGDEHLEAFDKGHFLFTYQQYSRSQDVCQIDITHEDLEIKEFELVGSALQDSAILHELTAHRYDNGEKSDFIAHIIDQQGIPIANATIRLQPRSKSSRSSQHLTKTSDSDGMISLSVFPREYSYSTLASGFIGERGIIDVPEQMKLNKPFEIVMRTAIRAKLYLEWKTQSHDPSTVISTGEQVLEVVGSISNNTNAHLSQWIRPAQFKNELYLTFYSPPQNQRGARDAPNLDPNVWIRTIPRTVNRQAHSEIGERAVLFNALDLHDAADMLEKYPLAKKDHSTPLSRQRHGTTLAAKNGSIFVGQLNQRDARTGRQNTLIFKVRVEIP